MYTVTIATTVGEFKTEHETLTEARQYINSNGYFPILVSITNKKGTKLPHARVKMPVKTENASII